MVHFLLFGTLLFAACKSSVGFVVAKPRTCSTTALSALDESKLCTVYLDAVAKANDGYYVGNWRPSSPRNLGDYGIFKNGQLQKGGNIDQLNLRFEGEVQESPGPCNDVILSRTARYNQINGKGGISDPTGLLGLDLGLNVKFFGKSSVFLAMPGSIEYSYKNLNYLRDCIRFLDNFPDKYEASIITSVVRCRKYVFALSAESDGEITFGASASVPLEYVNLNDVGVNLTMVHSTESVEYQNGELLDHELSKDYGYVLLYKMFRWKKNWLGETYWHVVRP